MHFIVWAITIYHPFDLNAFFSAANATENAIENQPAGSSNNFNKIPTYIRL